MNSIGGNIIINVNNICSLFNMIFGEYPTINRTLKIVGGLLGTLWSYYFVPKNQLISALTWNFINISIAFCAIIKPFFCKIWSKYVIIYPTENVEDNNHVITVQEKK